MSSARRSRTSLAHSTLKRMGVRVSVLIVVMTLFSYLHVFNALLTRTLDELKHITVERGQREQALFVLAEDNQAVLKKAIQEHFEAWRHEEPAAAFERFVVSRPDGSLRSRPENFDGTRQPCVFVPRGMMLDADMRRWILAARDVLSQYGPAFHVRFTDTYVTLPGGALVLYWPERPTWCEDATPELRVSDFEFFTLSTPRQDPSRETIWSGIVRDPVARTWTVSASTPVDQEGRHALTITQDILIEDLMSRTLNVHLPGTYNMLLREDGQLVAHPDVKLRDTSRAYNLLQGAVPSNMFESGSRLAEDGSHRHLLALFNWAFHRPEDEITRQFPEYGEYASAVPLKGPGWMLVTVLPEHLVSADALHTARYVLGFGFLSLLLELIIMSWVLREQISRPLKELTRATAQVSIGDFQVSFQSSRDDELGRLARGFGLMAQEIRRREEALRRSNEHLEEGIAERTRALSEQNLKLEEALRQNKETQELLVKKERLAALGSLMAGIAHELKNPLNFVNNFAVVSLELVDEVREEVKGARLRATPASPARMDELLDCLNQSVAKIGEHGMRVNRILQTMQRHSHDRLDAREATDLNVLLEEQLGLAAQSVRLAHPGFAVSLRKEFDATLAPVSVVSQDLARALLNVLTNSLYAVMEKHKRMGGAFTPEIAVHSQRIGSQVRISIRDNGTGIPRELQEKIFNPFFTTKPAGVGTGLGLSISHDIVVRQHKGELRIESSEGHYTECFIVLPLG